MDDIYRTFSQTTEGIYREKGSKFLAFGFSVQTEAEIAAILLDLRKKYYDARHHCYAWRLGLSPERVRSNDDGEPSGSAGLPILGQIRSKELTNVLIVVVRYFGGVKLGVGGLVQAYKTAAADAIASAEIVERTVDVDISIQFGYESMNKIMKTLKDLQLEITHTQFDLRCSVGVRLRKSALENLLNLLSKIEGVEVE